MAISPTATSRTDRTTMSANDSTPPQRRRAANRRTVLLLGAIALAIYAAFILSGIYGLQGVQP
jgi:hypothetical protein